MEEQTLRPLRNSIQIKGKISYRESTGCWSLIALSKQIIREFPQLKEKQSKFGFKMAFYYEHKDLERTVRKIKREGEALPILLWLVKEKQAY